MLPRLAPCYLLPLILYWVALTEAIRCYSCANDFIVWQWRHFFLKRNYGLSTSDSECSHTDFKPDSYQNCHSTCFMFLLNGTNKETGYTKTLGVGRGCSSQFLTDDQHLHLGLGTHSRASEVGEYLPHDFDKLDITEHWCFCATEKCNTYTCFSSPFGSREYANSYIAKRLQYSSYGSGGAGSNGWRYRNTGVGRGCSSQFLTDDQHLHFGLGTHSRASEVGEYLPHDFDKMDITEHWCFCATEKCNIYTCFSSPFGSREYANSYIAKRLQYSSYGSGGAGSNGEPTLDAYFRAPTMNKLTEIPAAPSSKVDGAMFLFICLIFVGVLLAVIKLCYNYSRNFPRKEEQLPAIQGLNRRCISIKGAKGTRYSVA